MAHTTLLSWLQKQYDEIYSVNESCLGQQPLRATCIVADASRSLTGVKLIRGLHDGFSLRFHVVEELHASAFELKIQVKLLCYMRQKKRHASSSCRNESGLGCASHTTLHTSFTQSSCSRDDGNAPLQLSQHRYIDRAVR